MRSGRIAVCGAVGVAVLFLASCSTEVGEKTKMGAATGGAIGAGVGALVGTQTGGVGPGILLGAAAGAGSGALIGNELDARNQVMKTQDEAIERQERQIAAQRSELDELRRMSSENVSFKSKPTQGFSSPAMKRPGMPMQTAQSTHTTGRVPVPAGQLKPPVRASSTSAGATISPSGLRETDLVTPTQAYQKPPATNSAPPMAALKQPANAQFYDSSAASNSPAPKVSGQAIGVAGTAGSTSAAANGAQGGNEWTQGTTTTTTTYVAKGAVVPGTPECKEAELEAGRAQSAPETADRLFHYRRALRLCPDNPGYHNGLGEVYLSLDRKADAEFEFREALNLDPDHQEAKNNLSTLQ